MNTALPMELTLPYPPSMNHYWRAGRGRHYISKAGLAFRKAVQGVVWEQLKGRAPRLSERVNLHLTVYRPDERKRDLDNLFKCTLDALVHAGILLDDHLVAKLGAHWAPEKLAGGRLILKLEAAV